ncbi:hypothetical protein D2V17_14920 [Aurantiacibacter xanthus]|uniref:Cytochrome c n=1 Tax=Aurantiacibacter xanthus TaxID=1784712 RepID=A0A3A1P1L7_9SPHN|nr:hypothetical protein [Aurantiacibacter xanthus]RIV82604.1 hypothetical protein D2V17_14920 [Aurantiacibacter xanthus]
MTRFYAKSLSLIVAAGLVGCSGQDAEQPADVDAATKSLMIAEVQTQAQIYWNAVQFISDENGLREIVPETDADWERTAEAARQLRSLGEELKRPAYAAGRGSDWQQFSQGLVDVAEKTEAAALSRDPHQVLEAGGVLYNVCSACHEHYMELPAGLSPNAPEAGDAQ